MTKQRRDRVPASGSGQRIIATGVEHELFRLIREIAGAPQMSGARPPAEQLSLFADEAEHVKRMDRLIELLLDPVGREQRAAALRAIEKSKARRQLNDEPKPRRRPPTNRKRQANPRRRGKH